MTALCKSFLHHQEVLGGQDLPLDHPTKKNTENIDMKESIKVTGVKVQVVTELEMKGSEEMEQGGPDKGPDKVILVGGMEATTSEDHYQHQIMWLTPPSGQNTTF